MTPSPYPFPLTLPSPPAGERMKVRGEDRGEGAGLP